MLLGFVQNAERSYISNSSLKREYQSTRVRGRRTLLLSNVQKSQSPVLTYIIGDEPVARWKVNRRPKVESSRLPSEAVIGRPPMVRSPDGFLGRCLDFVVQAVQNFATMSTQAKTTAQGVELDVAPAVSIPCRFWKADDGWIGTCEQFGISVQGASFEETKRALEEALGQHTHRALRLYSAVGAKVA